ncbi:hypothetical protein [Streptomyces cucumeris]|uniref:hypothetical protein n=1 Tax=Streptomyces cucumeris TaxID=2962890 RepID=UPI003D70CC69
MGPCAVRGYAQLWTEGESVPVKMNQTMVLGVIVVGVLWINSQGDGDSGDGKSPGPRETGRYHVQKDDGKDKKDKKKDGKDDKGGKKGGHQRPQPHPTVSYPIKFPHHDRKKSRPEPRSTVSYPIKHHRR